MFYNSFAILCLSLVLSGCFHFGTRSQKGECVTLWRPSPPEAGGWVDQTLMSGGPAGMVGLFLLRMWRKKEEAVQLAKEVADEPDVAAANKKLVQSKVRL